jgi:hypothetical protein
MNLFTRGLYLFTIFGVLFTGFGNMPLYRRYYIADLPGLGWTGDFYTNLYIHIICGFILLALSIYYLITYLFAKRLGVTLTKAGAIRAVILAFALLSGIIMALIGMVGRWKWVKKTGLPAL